ncbi:MAG: sigma 54-interacting transcriptional regulator [Desulfobacterales bacterium]|jgi:transcriptional regulator with GAF, ATPase, and Fis domain|nr:sigma 54-interacting transcriptional regulator [Desulfobacterales bacterium]
MKPISFQKTLRELKRLDGAITRDEVAAAAEGALRHFEQSLKHAHVSLVLEAAGGQPLRMLVRSESGIASFDLPAADAPAEAAALIPGGKTFYCRRLTEETRRRGGFFGRVPREIRSIALIPLSSAGRRVGTLIVGSKRVDGIAAGLRLFLEAAAPRLAAALRNAQALEELRGACEHLQSECDLQKSALQRSRDELELEVARRTAEISKLQERLHAENIYLKEELAGVHAYGSIIGESPSLKSVLSRIELVAPTGANVLILGESGTGKELIAREIHARSTRRDRPLIKVNCATIAKELYESEFFGHVKGSFTGATSDRMGRFEAADGGTLFLDEVGEIPPGLQGKLLRVLQEGEFERVGEGRTRKVDVRLIAATNKNLVEEIKNGRFREDLYYRLNVFPIEVMPLRARKEDIPLLAAHFIEVFSRRLSRPAPRFTEANLMDLRAHSWPGNVRELQNILERALILSPHGRLRLDLPRTGAEVTPPDRGRPAADAVAEASILTDAELSAIRKSNMLAALVRSNWRIYGAKGAAALLGIKPTTLIERMRRFGVKRPA